MKEGERVCLSSRVTACAWPCPMKFCFGKCNFLGSGRLRSSVSETPSIGSVSLSDSISSPSPLACFRHFSSSLSLDGSSWDALLSYLFMFWFILCRFQSYIHEGKILQETSSSASLGAPYDCVLRQISQSVKCRGMGLLGLLVSQSEQQSALPISKSIYADCTPHCSFTL